MTEKLKRDNLAFGKMKNDEIVEYMKERFDLMADNQEKFEKNLDKRLDKIDSDIAPLIEYKAKSEGSMSTLKYIIGIGFTVITIIIGLIAIHLKRGTI